MPIVLGDLDHRAPRDAVQHLRPRRRRAPGLPSASTRKTLRGRALGHAALVVEEQHLVVARAARCPLGRHGRDVVGRDLGLGRHDVGAAVAALLLHPDPHLAPGTAAARPCGGSRPSTGIVGRDRHGDAIVLGHHVHLDRRQEGTTSSPRSTPGIGADRLGDGPPRDRPPRPGRRGRPTSSSRASGTAPRAPRRRKIAGLRGACRGRSGSRRPASPAGGCGTGRGPWPRTTESSAPVHPDPAVGAFPLRGALASFLGHARKVITGRLGRHPGGPTGNFSYTRRQLFFGSDDTFRRAERTLTPVGGKDTSCIEDGHSEKD